MPEAFDPPWFKILGFARVLGKDYPTGFTAAHLSELAGLAATEHSSAAAIASMWLAKFRKWGYAQVLRTMPPPKGQKPMNLYGITDLGNTVTMTPGTFTNLHRLVSAIRDLQAKKGTTSEKAAYTKLIEICDEVVPLKDEA